MSDLYGADPSSSTATLHAHSLDASEEDPASNSFLEGLLVAGSVESSPPLSHSIVYGAPASKTGSKRKANGLGSGGGGGGGVKRSQAFRARGGTKVSASSQAVSAWAHSGSGPLASFSATLGLAHAGGESGMGGLEFEDLPVDLGAFEMPYGSQGTIEALTLEGLFPAHQSSSNDRNNDIDSISIIPRSSSHHDDSTNDLAHPSSRHASLSLPPPDLPVSPLPSTASHPHSPTLDPSLFPSNSIEHAHAQARLAAAISAERSALEGSVGDFLAGSSAGIRARIGDGEEGIEVGRREKGKGRAGREMEGDGEHGEEFGEEVDELEDDEDEEEEEEEDEEEGEIVVEEDYNVAGPSRIASAVSDSLSSTVGPSSSSHFPTAREAAASFEGEPGRPHHCPDEDCDKKFVRKSDFLRHYRIHTGERPFPCTHQGCGKDFIQRTALTVHLRVHSGDKPHECPSCQRLFSDSSSLARHKRVHEGTKPFPCPHCSTKSFSRKATLVRHMTICPSLPGDEGSSTSKRSKPSKPRSSKPKAAPKSHPSALDPYAIASIHVSDPHAHLDIDPSLSDARTTITPTARPAHADDDDDDGVVGAVGATMAAITGMDIRQHDEDIAVGGDGEEVEQAAIQALVSQFGLRVAGV